jgi:hypothetical protein
MSGYSIDDFRRDLEQQLAPHSILIDLVDATDTDITVETRRINGTDLRRTVTLSVTQLTPVMTRRFAEIVMDTYGG